MDIYIFVHFRGATPFLLRVFLGNSYKENKRRFPYSGMVPIFWYIIVKVLLALENNNESVCGGGVILHAKNKHYSCLGRRGTNCRHSLFVSCCNIHLRGRGETFCPDISLRSCCGYLMSFVRKRGLI